MARLILDKEEKVWSFYTEILLNKSDLHEFMHQYLPTGIASSGYFAIHGSLELGTHLGYKLNGRLYPIEDFKIVQRSRGSTGFYIDVLEKV